jgi:hypothetical protein
MRLRDHPKLSGKWPPIWNPLQSPGVRGLRKVYGERPSRLLAAREAESSIVLKVLHENNEFTGHLPIDDADFRKKLLQKLNKNIRRSIRSIGSIYLDF